jgi:hypothetical protein
VCKWQWRTLSWEPVPGISDRGRPYPPGAGDPGAWLTAHSIYFLLLGELGVPGLALLLTFIFGTGGKPAMLREAASCPDQVATARNALASTSAALVAFAPAGVLERGVYRTCASWRNADGGAPRRSCGAQARSMPATIRLSRRSRRGRRSGRAISPSGDPPAVAARRRSLV